MSKPPLGNTCSLAAFCTRFKDHRLRTTLVLSGLVTGSIDPRKVLKAVELHVCERDSDEGILALIEVNNKTISSALTQRADSLIPAASQAFWHQTRSIPAALSR
jgi:hypothetical protein